MKVRSKNIAITGAVLALTFLLCGLFQREVFAMGDVYQKAFWVLPEWASEILMYVWLTIITCLVMATWMLPIFLLFQCIRKALKR